MTIDEASLARASRFRDVSRFCQPDLPCRWRGHGPSLHQFGDGLSACSTVITGRAELITTELTAFYKHPVLGIGVGKGIEYREENLGIRIASHNEISRLLAEHGVLGVFALLILIVVPLIFWFKFKNNYFFLAFVAFWFLTINHSAMRIAMPAFVYGLALLYIVDEKKDPIYRKRLAD